ncbi:hypothetical protein RA8CHR_04972 [Variovorax sp. RA8]|nr:hypothetical protein RA8CHR_04972 [Variovorax sp. RA8]
MVIQEVLGLIAVLKSFMQSQMTDQPSTKLIFTQTLLEDGKHYGETP